MIGVTRIIYQNLVLVVVTQQAKQTHNLLVGIVVFVRESYLFCDSCKCWIKESRNQQHHTYFEVWLYE